MAVLLAGFIFWMFGSQLTQPAKTEMILRLFKNDTAAAAKMVGSLSSMAALIGLFGNPLIGSLSDAVGRKPVLLVGVGCLRCLCRLRSLAALSSLPLIHSIAVCARRSAQHSPSYAIASGWCSRASLAW